MSDIGERIETPFAIQIDYIRLLHNHQFFFSSFPFLARQLHIRLELYRLLLLFFLPGLSDLPIEFMQNVKSYFSSWKPFWKSSNNSCHSQTLTLAPSNINFTSSSLGDLKHSVIDEKLMIDISTKLMESDCPPKLQICAHNNQWFALNNSHLLVYRQLERIGLCDTVGKYC